MHLFFCVEGVKLWSIKQIGLMLRGGEKRDAFVFWGLERKIACLKQLEVLRREYLQ